MLPMMDVKVMHGPHGFRSGLCALENSAATTLLSEEEAARAIAGMSSAQRTDRRLLTPISISLDIRTASSWWRQSKLYFGDVDWVRARGGESDAQRTILTTDFEDPVPELVVQELRRMIVERARDQLTVALPESYIRRGHVHTSYATLRRIMHERRHYQYGHWHLFCAALRKLPVSLLILED